MRRFNPRDACLAFMVCLRPLLASAQPVEFYWDVDGATPGAGGASPAGVWDAYAATNWSASVNGDVDAVVWPSDSVAVFSAGTNATDAFTVTVGSSVTVDSMRFEEGTVGLTGEEIDLAGSGRIDVSPNLTATIGSVLGGLSDLTKTGAGTLELGGPCVYYGITTVAAGTLRLDASEVIPDRSDVFVTAGATFDVNGFTE